MFSFHKPKVYRSSTGCCICKAKSSSSRFTDSKKYEEDFMKCFMLEERRTGEICNACVLLVKRWKKLPVDSGRNWHHVVDARAGPGIKSLTKFKAKNKKKTVAVKKKHEERMESDDSEENVVDNESKSASREGSPASSVENGLGEKIILDIDHSYSDVSDFIDLTYFKSKSVCCGIIFVGLCGEIMVEPSLYKPCLRCLARRQQQRDRATSVNTLASSTVGSSPAHSSASTSPCHSSASASPAHSVESMVSTDSKGSGKGFACDSSSDSGYDDTSNPGENKKLQLLLQPSSPSMLHMLAKPGKPAVKLLQSVKPEPMMPTIVSAPPTSIRLKSLNSTKVPIKLLCKPVALVSSAKLSLAGGGSVLPDSVLSVLPPTVDFAVRPPPQRSSLAN